MQVRLPLPGGAQIVLPDSLELITPYVLREQGDWFEDEIRFVRTVVEPGDTVIDVGANYGVYALSLCPMVGETGAVWAFEPASDTAAWLRRSIAENGFRQLALEQAALSDRSGSARLALAPSSELNRLARDGEPGESVVLKTLDQCLAEHGWDDVALVKLDAEGEELAIVRGGAAFFARLSPLVMFELRDGSGVHPEVVAAFAALGYAAYRLVPGLGVLAPMDDVSALDPAALNLFCCKPDRAARLAARRLLAGHAAAPAPAADWMERLERMPYAARLAPSWRFNAEDAAPGGDEYADALGLHAAAMDEGVVVAARCAALAAAHVRLAAARTHAVTPARLSTAARVAWALGHRTACVEALAPLVRPSLAGEAPGLGEPFLPASARFDALVPDALEPWFGASVLEQFERARAFSSFYTGDSAIAIVDRIAALGYASDEMRARRAVAAARAAAQAGGARR
jgi:FkbM family methyltransferase